MELHLDSFPYLHVVVSNVELHLVFLARQQQGEPLSIVGRRQGGVQQWTVLPPHRLQHGVHAGELGETFYWKKHESKIDINLSWHYINEVLLATTYAVATVALHLGATIMIENYFFAVGGNQPI